MAAGRWLALLSFPPARGRQAGARFLPALKQAPGDSALFLSQARHEFDQIAGAGALIKLVADEFIPGCATGAR